jgi:peptidoglycan DL-endopeptidase CwlO
MTPHRRRDRARPGRRTAGVLVAATATTIVLGALADSATADPTPSIAAVQKQVENLEHQAELATESFNATRERLRSATVMGEATTTRMRQQAHNVQVARAALGRLAVETYKAGDLQTLSMVLDDNPGSALATGGLLTTMADRRADGVAHLVLEQSRLTQDRAQAVTQQKALSAASAQLDTLKREVDAKLAAAQSLLSRLKANQRAALFRASQTGDREALASVGVEVPAKGSLTCADVGVDGPNPRAKLVLGFACAQLGKSYLWAGDGPSAYDCSGLTMRAWEAAGVTLPHNAAMQAGEGTRVALGSVEPGDLIFFHSPISHVGIYIGKGLMVHAPHSGDVVRIAPARGEAAVAAVRF